MRRGWTLAVAVLLTAAGVAFAVAGFRLLGLERARSTADARKRVEEALVVVARLAERVAAEPTTPPAGRWTLEARPRVDPGAAVEGWAALLLSQAEHLEGPGRDPEQALTLYAQVTDDATAEGWHEIASLRAAVVAIRLDRRDEALRHLARAAMAPRTLVDPRGTAVSLAAHYHLAALEWTAEHVGAFLALAGDGHRLSDQATAGPDDLILALWGRNQAHPPLNEAAERARLGQRVLRALPEDGVAVVQPGEVARRQGRVLQIRPPESLLENVAVTEATALRILPTAADREDGDSMRALAPPLEGLAVHARPVEPEGSGGAFVGLVAGLLVYVLGAVLALVAIHRSQRAARMQSDFIAAVSHELKTPIASVRAMAEFLADGPAGDEEKVRDYARRIESEMGRLGTSVRNVLDTARIERQGALRVSLQPGEPAEVVDAVVQAFAPTLAARGFDFDVDVVPASRTVRLDPAALQSALMNLIDNAAKFSSDRRAIEVEARPVGHAYRIDVRDRGRGIGTGDASRLFGRFVRAEAVRQDAVPGVGLGLYVVREIVQAHAGTVEARPRPDGGTEVRVELPLVGEGGPSA